MTSEEASNDDSTVVGWATYSHLWRIPNMPQLLVGFVLSRLPTGMVALALALSTLQHSRSLALSGLVSGCYALGMAIGMPVTGRLVDRRGPLNVLTVTGLLYPFMLVTFAAVVANLVPLGTWALLASAVIAGAVLPPVAPVVRSVWSTTLDATAARAATAVENTLVNAFYVAGPAVVGLLTVWHVTPVALLISALSVTLGIPLVALHTDARALPRTVGRLRRLEALHQPALKSVLVLLMAYTAADSGLTWAVISWAEDRGHPGLTGVIFAVSGAAGLLSALVYGTGWGPLRRLSLTAAFAGWTITLAVLGVVTVAHMGFVAVMLATVLVESALAPLFSLLIDRLVGAVSPRLRTESFAWRQTALMVGGAAGSSICGLLGARVGIAGPVVFGVLVGVGGSLLAARGRTPTAEQPPEEPASPGTATATASDPLLQQAD